ncbi:MAG: hypothetical protein JST28_12915 [Acidobacteria bacterium]|nr:hypothetical protein [Acidobacteriota bacterium]
MEHASLVVPRLRLKRRVYVAATLTGMAILLPFQHHVWAPYAATSVSYSILVLGLRRLELTPKPHLFAILPGRGLATYALFLCVATFWIWLLIALIPHLPYILRTEDTSHPYFGLAFIGVLCLLLLEAAEQRSLRRLFHGEGQGAPKDPMGETES